MALRASLTTQNKNNLKPYLKHAALLYHLSTAAFLCVYPSYPSTNIVKTL